MTLNRSPSLFTSNAMCDPGVVVFEESCGLPEMTMLHFWFFIRLIKWLGDAFAEEVLLDCAAVRLVGRTPRRATVTEELDTACDFTLLRDGGNVLAWVVLDVASKTTATARIEPDFKCRARITGGGRW